MFGGSGLARQALGHVLFVPHFSVNIATAVDNVFVNVPLNHIIVPVNASHKSISDLVFDQAMIELHS